MPTRPARGSAAPSLQDLRAAFVAVLAGLCSLGLVIVTVMIGITLGRMRIDAGQVHLAPVSAFDAVWAAAWAVGVPLVLSLWAHRKEGSIDLAGVGASMTWLPTLTNGVGLAIGLVTAPSLMAQALRSTDSLVARTTGEQSSLTQAASALAHESARVLDGPVQRPTGLLTREVGQDQAHTQNIALDVSGNGVFVDLELKGPAGSMKSTYLFDTGASYTTITRDQAAKLGIKVPADAPSLEFNTAAGLRKSPMVYLPKLTLGEVSIEGVLVSVCDSCATPRYPGLLGINVMREFHVALDYQSRHMQLTPRIYDGPANRAYDIEPTLSMKIVGRPEVWMRNIRWTARVKNRGTRPIHNVILRVRFNQDSEVLSKPIAKIEPGASATTPIQGRLEKHLPKSAEFTLSLASAQW